MWGKGYVAVFIFNLGANVGAWFLSGSCRFNPSKFPQYALGGPHIRSEHFEVCINIFSWLQIPNVSA
jgi:hypothetical protein